MSASSRPSRFCKCSKRPATDKVAEVRIQVQGCFSRWARSCAATDSGVLCSTRVRLKVSNQYTRLGADPSRMVFRVITCSAARRAQASSPRLVFACGARDASRSTSASSSAEPASTTAGVSCTSDQGARRSASPRLRRRSWQALSTAATVWLRAARSSAEWAASDRASRPSSCTWRVLRESPKKLAAISGNWWASSKITVLALGSNSETPSPRNAASAKNRW